MVYEADDLVHLDMILNILKKKTGHTINLSISNKGSIQYIQFYYTIKKIKTILFYIDISSFDVFKTIYEKKIGNLKNSNEEDIINILDIINI